MKEKDLLMLRERVDVGLDVVPCPPGLEGIHESPIVGEGRGNVFWCGAPRTLFLKSLVNGLRPILPVGEHR